MANLQERRDKSGKLISYSIRVHRGRGPDGRQLKPWTATFDVSPTWTEKNARKKAEAFAATFEKECREGVTSDSRQKFGPYCEYVINLKEQLGTVKHSTISSYRDLAVRINPAIGHIRLKDLRADHLNDLYTALSQKGTRKGEARAAAKIDIAAQLKARKITRASIAKNSGLSERIVSAAVKGEKVSLDAARVVSGTLGLKLEDAFEVKGDDRPFVFSQDNGKPMHPDGVTTWLDRFSKRHDLPHINPHAFRHTMASMLYFNGVDSVSISKRLGHAQVSTTANIYAHIMEEADQRNADILANVFLKKA